MSLLYSNVKVDETHNMSNVMRCYGKDGGLPVGKDGAWGEGLGMSGEW